MIPKKDYLQEEEWHWQVLQDTLEDCVADLKAAELREVEKGNQ